MTTPLVLAPDSRRVLLVFTRRPCPGEVKTRLIPTLGAAGACRLHELLLDATLALAAGTARRTGCEIVIAWSGEDEAGTWTGPLEQRRLRLIRQSGQDLGHRMERVQARLFDEGVASIVTIGSDSPTLPAARLDAAFAHLDHADVVLAPASDGGYVLLGVARPVPELLRDMPWGGDQVSEVTRRRAQDAGLVLVELPGWYDVDDAPSLARLQAELDAAPADDLTRLRLGLAGLAGSPGAPSGS